MGALCWALITWRNGVGWVVFDLIWDLGWAPFNGYEKNCDGVHRLVDTGTQAMAMALGLDHGHTKECPWQACAMYY